MNSEEFSKALEHISEPFIDSAAYAYENRGHRRRKYMRLLRVAAIAAVLALLLTVLSFWPVGEENYVLGPGLLVVRAYGAEDNTNIPVEGVVLEEGICLEALSWNMLSNRPGLPISLHFPEAEYGGMDISFEIMLSGGSFYRQMSPFDENGNLEDAYTNRKKSYLGDHFSVDNFERLYFQPYSTTFDDNTQSGVNTWIDGRKVFVEIIIYADTHIVGYSVIAFYANLDPSFAQSPEFEGMDPAMLRWSAFGAELLEAKSFPLVSGRFQNVDREYLETQFERIRFERG